MEPGIGKANLVKISANPSRDRKEAAIPTFRQWPLTDVRGSELLGRNSFPSRDRKGAVKWKNPWPTL